eukprot:4784152-Amphidinium_carterae.1
MTIPLGNDKERFHWSVSNHPDSNGTGDWRDYPVRTFGDFCHCANPRDVSKFGTHRSWHSGAQRSLDQETWLGERCP